MADMNASSSGKIEDESTTDANVKLEQAETGLAFPSVSDSISFSLPGPSSPQYADSSDVGGTVARSSTNHLLDKKARHDRPSSSGEPQTIKKRKESMSRSAGNSKDDDKDAEEGALGKSKRESQEEERMKMQLLVSNFSEDQLNRYEMFRRAAFPKAAVKRLMQSISGTTVSPSVVIAMSGIAKVYVGEIVETALDALERQGQTGPLQPKHVREAVRRIKQKSGIPTTKHKKLLFRRS